MSKPNGDGNAVGILLVSHGEMCKYLLEAAETIYQHPIKRIRTLAISNKETRKQLSEKIKRHMQTLAKHSNSILVLCDCSCGATPSRLVSNLDLPGLDMRCVFGVNLPMLLDCVNASIDTDLDALVERICTVGRDAISWREPSRNA